MDVISTVVPIEIDILPQNLVYLLNSAGRYGHICFFDSSLVPNKYSKFSYVCFKPRFVVKSNGKESTFLNCLSGEKQILNINPLLFLKEISIAAITQNNIIYHFDWQHDSANTGKNNLPDFIGGLAGYISYDLKNYMERLPQKAKDDIFLPLFMLVYYDSLMAYDIDNKKWFFIKNFVVKHQEMSKTSGSIQDYLQDCIKKDIKEVILDSNFTKTNYLETVKKAKKFIHNGDIYQVNMTQRFKCILDVDPYSLYYVLRQKNAAPFSAFLSFPEVKIGSSSPERFLFLKNGFIQTRPIKGTRPRGGEDNEDLKYMSA